MGHIGAVSTASMLPFTSLAFEASTSLSERAATLRFGIVSDVHKDLIPDANERLEKFIDKARRENVDFIIQLGDFCMGDPKNKDFLSIWESFKGPKYHVLGNHDMDKNSKSEMLDFWGMPKTHYSFDTHGIHFIVLDANFLYQDGKFTDYDKANFYVDSSLRTYVNDEQIEWFKGEIEQTKLPTIVFSHQSLWHYQWGVTNRLAIQQIMETNSDKIICCMNGHNHIDFHRHQNGIDYIEINSMSYQWMDDKYRSTAHYPKEFYENYGSLPNIAPYKDPLFAFATVDPAGSFMIDGVKSEWVHPSPAEMGMPSRIYGLEYSATMSDYQLKF